MENLNYLMDHILYQIFKITLKILNVLKILNILEKHETVTDNPSIRIYINKIDNRSKLKIKSGYYLELLTPETMKILGGTKTKITKDETGEDIPYLEITEVVLIHCNKSLE